MYLVRKHTGAAYSEIGRHFGDRNHSTVISADKKVQGWLRDEQQNSLLPGFETIADVLADLERTFAWPGPPRSSDLRRHAPAIGDSAICLAACSGSRSSARWCAALRAVSGGDVDVGVGGRSSFSSLRSSCSSRSATARGRVSLSSSACGGGTAARNGLPTGPGIETAAGALCQGCVSAWPILESGTDDAAGVGGVGSNAVGGAAEGTADVATAGVVVGTTVIDEAEDGAGAWPGDRRLRLRLGGLGR